LISSGIARSKLRSPASTCRHRNQQLRRHQRRRHRRIHVADHDHEVGALFEAHLFEADHHVARLHGVAGRSDFKVAIGHRQRQFSDETLGHRLVVVLPRIHENLANAGHAAERVHERRDLHVVGPRAHHVQDGLLRSIHLEEARYPSL